MKPPTNKVPYGYCQCGCGEKTKIAHINRTARNWVKGEPKRFMPGHNNAHIRLPLEQPSTHKLLNLGNGIVAEISNLDWQKCQPFTWTFSNGYVTCVAKSLSLHRFIKDPPKNKDVDHKDRNPLNNRRCNLRIVSRSQNNMNAKARSNSKSGLKGVLSRRGGYTVKIKVDGKVLYLGFVFCRIEAGRLYDQAAIKYFGKFACTNERLGLL